LLATAPLLPRIFLEWIIENFLCSGRLFHPGDAGVDGLTMHLFLLVRRFFPPEVKSLRINNPWLPFPFFENRENQPTDLTRRFNAYRHFLNGCPLVRLPLSFSPKVFFFFTVRLALEAF